MIATFPCLVLDRPGPRSLARFYERLLGGEVDRPGPRWSVDEDWVTLHVPGGQVLCFQRAADHRPPRRSPPFPPAGPRAPQQAHLDLRVPGLDAAGPAVLAAGVTAPTPPGPPPDTPQGRRVQARPATRSARCCPDAALTLRGSGARRRGRPVRIGA